MIVITIIIAVCQHSPARVRAISLAEAAERDRAVHFQTYLSAMHLLGCPVEVGDLEGVLARCPPQGINSSHVRRKGRLHPQLPNFGSKGVINKELHLEDGVAFGACALQLARNMKERSRNCIA